MHTFMKLSYPFLHYTTKLTYTTIYNILLNLNSINYTAFHYTTLHSTGLNYTTQHYIAPPYTTYYN